MDLNSVPYGNRVHISLFGKRNVGKSSIINALTNQNISIVSNLKGTTTDPVAKAMELLPLGAVVITDTAGLDDDSDLGQLRVDKTIEVLNKTDIALLVLEAKTSLDEFEQNILQIIKSKNIPCLIVINKIDTINECDIKVLSDCKVIPVSALTKLGIDNLKQALANITLDNTRVIISDLISPSDIVILVVPIDNSAPKGRLILPQQQTIREILDTNAIAIVTQETELASVLNSLNKPPKIVVTDSQAFSKVSKLVPNNILLTSFSILFARYKGDLEQLLKGIEAIDSLKDGDKILIAEGCTHHRQCNDIGTVKIPKLLKKHTGKDFIYETSSGISYPKDLKQYSLIIHCGGCTLNNKQMMYRIDLAKQNNVPIVNYGIILAYINGILKRSIEPLIKK